MLLVAVVMLLSLGAGWAVGRVLGDGPEAIAAAPPSGPHAFTAMAADGVTPVAYDHCRPVRWVLRSDHLPAGGAELVEDAVSRVAELTGLDFRYAGTTDEAPSVDRPLEQRGRYGDGWAPVLIAFETVAENPELEGDVAGQAGSALAAVTSSSDAWVTGIVRLDAEWFAETIDADREQARAVVLHELGHLVGLAHVDDSSQLMNEAYIGVPEFQDGDLAGLAALGRVACATGR